ncbi:copper chaperone PCu(A)C [Aliidiomarina sp. Khilg15.8]
MRVIVLSAAVLVNLFCVTALASQSLEIQDLWLRESVPGTENGAAFGVFANRSNEDIVIIGADSDAADRVEIHQHLHQNGEMRMEEIEALPIAAGEKVTLQPGGYHIMLFGLKAPLATGNEHVITLYLSNGEQAQMTAKVRSLMHGQDNSHQH